MQDTEDFVILMLLRPSISDKRFPGVSGLRVSVGSQWFDSWYATQPRNVLVITCCARFTSLTRNMTGLIVGSAEEGLCQTLRGQMESTSSPLRTGWIFSASAFFYCTWCYTLFCGFFFYGDNIVFFMSWILVIYIQTHSTLSALNEGCIL